MGLRIQVIRRGDWRSPASGLVQCDTTKDAADELIRLMADGELCARAAEGAQVALLACRNADGTATIASRHGMMRVTVGGQRTPEPITPRYVGQGGVR